MDHFWSKNDQKNPFFDPFWLKNGQKRGPKMDPFFDQNVGESRLNGSGAQKRVFKNGPKRVKKRVQKMTKKIGVFPKNVGESRLTCPKRGSKNGQKPVQKPTFFRFLIKK